RSQDAAGLRAGIHFIRDLGTERLGRHWDFVFTELRVDNAFGILDSYHRKGGRIRRMPIIEDGRVAGHDVVVCAVSQFEQSIVTVEPGTKFLESRFLRIAHDGDVPSTLVM